MTKFLNFAVVVFQDLTESPLKAICCLFCEQVKDFHIWVYQDSSFSLKLNFLLPIGGRNSVLQVATFPLPDTVTD